MLPESHLEFAIGGSYGNLHVYGFNTSSATAELLTYYGDPASADQYVYDVTNTTDYSHTLIVLDGPCRHAYSEVFASVAPSVAMYLRLFETQSDGNAGLEKRRWICLPPHIDVADGETMVFLVGENGETFHSADWNANLSNIPTNPVATMTVDDVASEWAEMWSHGTRFRTSEGLISVSPSVPMQTE